jgi:hypothetical protein
LDFGSANLKAFTCTNDTNKEEGRMRTHIPVRIPIHDLNNLRNNMEAYDASFRTNFVQLFPFSGAVKLYLRVGFTPSFRGKLQQVGMRLSSAEQVIEISFTPR